MLSHLSRRPRFTSRASHCTLLCFRFCQRAMSQNLRHFMLFNANESRQHQQTRQFPVARTPSITQNGRKWAENGRRTRHARKTVLTRNRPAHTPRTPTHTRDAHTSARHARQRMHTCTHTHASACTRTHAHTPTHTGGRTRPHAHARTRAHAGAPAPAHTRDPELAAPRARLQVRCKRAVCRSERDAWCGFA